METLGGVLLVAFAVVLAAALPIAVMAWLEVRSVRKKRAVRGGQFSERPVTSTRPGGRAVYGRMTPHR